MSRSAGLRDKVSDVESRNRPDPSQKHNRNFLGDHLVAEKTMTGISCDPGQFIDALLHPDPDVRWEAARALGVLRDPKAVEPLIAALGDRDPDVRRKAALSLAKIKDPRAVEALRSCSLKDENQVVRWAAAFGLGRFQERKTA